MDSNALDLTPKRRRALEALVTGANVTQAAQAAGVARETVSHWLHHDQAFQHELATARREVWESTVDGLRMLVPRALAELARSLQSKRPTTRLRAASLILKAAGFTSHNMLPPPAPPGQADGVEGTGPEKVEEQLREAFTTLDQQERLGAFLAGLDREGMLALAQELTTRLSGSQGP